MPHVITECPFCPTRGHDSVKYDVVPSDGTPFSTPLFSLAREESHLKKRLGEEGFSKLLEKKEASFTTKDGTLIKVYLWSEEDKKRYGKEDWT